MGLLVGCHSREGRNLIDKLLGPLLISATVCSSTAELLHQILKERQPFHWILVEGEASRPKERHLTRLIRGRLDDVPITFFSFPGIDHASLGLPPALLCAVENSSRGKKVLNCRLVNRSMPGSASPSPQLADLLFEYQGPVPGTTDSGPEPAQQS